MNLSDIESNTFDFINTKIGNFKSDLAIILGSGLSDLTSDLDNKKIIPYNDIPRVAFPKVDGHTANFVYGTLHGVNILFLEGRPHWYQDIDPSIFHIFMQVIKSFGCSQILITNAAGAISPSIPVGSIVAIKDHINFQGKNPLIGLTKNNSCFLGLENCYDKEFRKKLSVIADKNKITLQEGVYIGTIGPCFETPAEIEMFKVLGGDVVGMSTIPEVITAKYYGFKVAVLSLISNLAAGCGDENLSHELTLSRVKMASGNLRTLVSHFIASTKTNKI